MDKRKAPRSVCVVVKLKTYFVESNYSIGKGGYGKFTISSGDEVKLSYPLLCSKDEMECAIIINACGFHNRVYKQEECIISTNSKFIADLVLTNKLPPEGLLSFVHFIRCIIKNKKLSLRLEQKVLS